MVIWHGNIPAPSLDPYKRELHDVPMYYAMAQDRDSIAMRCLLHVCGLIVAFVCGFMVRDCQ
jgi:hypothetical protein